MPSEFQKLLHQAKKQKKPEPIQKEEPKKPLISSEVLSKIAALPSDFMPATITAKKPTPKAEPMKVEKARSKGVKDSKDAQQPEKPKKNLSFKQLMKIAKHTKPEGLFVKESDTKSTDDARQGERAAIRSGASSEVGRSVSPIPPKVHSKQSLASNREKVRLEKERQNRLNPSPRKTVVKKNPLERKQEFIKLNVEKRDLASIEDIQTQILKRKGVFPSDIESKAATKNEMVVKAAAARSGNKEPSIRKQEKSSSSVKSDSRPNSAKSSISGTEKGKSSKPAVSSSKKIPTSRSVQDYDRKRKYSDSEDEDANPRHISSEIQKIFGYNRNRYRDDFSDDDMEVSYNQLEREERKSLKLGKMEDEIEEQKLLAKKKLKGA